MQTHNKKIYKFLDEHLPYEYALAVVKKLAQKKITVSLDVVRNVRNSKTVSNLQVLNALLLVAKENKKLKESLSEELTK